MSPLPIVAAGFVVGVLLAAYGGGVAIALLAAISVVAGLTLRRRAPGISAVALVSAAVLAGWTRGLDVAIRPRSGTQPSTGLLTGEVVRGCTVEGDSTHCEVRDDDGALV